MKKYYFVLFISISASLVNCENSEKQQKDYALNLFMKCRKMDQTFENPEDTLRKVQRILENYLKTDSNCYVCITTLKSIYKDFNDTINLIKLYNTSIQYLSIPGRDFLLLERAIFYENKGLFSLAENDYNHIEIDLPEMQFSDSFSFYMFKYQYYYYRCGEKRTLNEINKIKSYNEKNYIAFRHLLLSEIDSSKDTLAKQINGIKCE